MTIDKDALLKAAAAARKHAYAPHSKYEVGAAVLTASGNIYTGCNVENASYSLTNCAERTAVFKAVSEGDRDLVAIALALPGASSPCGACRQVLYEHNKKLVVVIGDEHGTFDRETTAAALLPDAFTL